MSLLKAVEKAKPGLLDKIHETGTSKIALELMKQEGLDFGKFEDLDIIKVASVLGKKLMEIELENASIMNGLNQLRNLGE